MVLTLAEAAVEGYQEYRMELTQGGMEANLRHGGRSLDERPPGQPGPWLGECLPSLLLLNYLLFMSKFEICEERVFADTGKRV